MAEPVALSCFLLPPLQHQLINIWLIEQKYLASIKNILETKQLENIKSSLVSCLHLHINYFNTILSSDIRLYYSWSKHQTMENWSVATVGPAVLWIISPCYCWFISVLIVPYHRKLIQLDNIVDMRQKSQTPGNYLLYIQYI